MPTKTSETGSESTDATAGGPKVPARRKTAASGGKPLVIVESPTKANKIAGYLGSGYVVEASVGHIRDLPRNAADVPAEHKGAAWARLGVDVDNSFEPLYVVSPDRRQQVSRLKQLVKGASEVYLATDEDREGEAIAWHLVDTLKPTRPGAPDGLPRDHPRGHRPRRRQPARAGHRAGRRPGDPPHPRPALRLRGQPRAVEEGAAQAVGRPGAVRRHAHRRGARAGADGLPRRRLLVARGHLRRPRAGRRHRRGRAHHGEGQAGQRRRQPGRHRQGLRPGDRTGERRRRAPRRGRRPRPGRPARGPPDDA